MNIIKVTPTGLILMEGHQFKQGEEGENII